MSRNRWNYSFLKPEVFGGDLDEPYLRQLGEVEAKPVVFVQGLHRSGTTFLLNSLYDLYPAVSTNVYHIANYRRLLHARKNGEEDLHKEEIARYLDVHGLRNRQIDAVPVWPESLDEYGFIFARFHVPYTLTWLLRQIYAKLCFLEGDARLVLLKDPVSFTSFVLIRAVFPEAKFIFIHRDPRQVFDSQVRAHLTRHVRYRMQDPFMALLMGRKVPRRYVFQSYLTPTRFARREAATVFSARIQQEVEGYLREIPFLPPECYVDVEYERLVNDTEATLARIVELIGIEPSKPLSSVRASPRRASPLPPDLAAAADDLAARLERLGYGSAGRAASR